jgi:lipopolysaccharide export LptBFGC system permease protein LptF
MLRFQRALLLEILLVFTAILVVTTGVIFTGMTLSLVVRGEGSGIQLIFDLIPSLVPLALSYSVPFAWLAAVALVIGRMVQDREITALRSAGLHLRTVALPVLALGLVLSTATMAFNAYGLPDAQRALRAGVRRYLPIFLGSLKDVDRTIALSNGRFSFGSYENGVFHDVELDRRAYDGSLELKAVAREASIQRVPDPSQHDALQFTFKDLILLSALDTGRVDVSREPAMNFQMGSVQKIGASVLFNQFFGTRRFVERARDMDLPDLIYADERGGIWRGSQKRAGSALHRGLSLGFASLTMGLLAMALAFLLPATGRRVRDFVVCFTTPVVLYFPFFLAGTAFGRAGSLPPWLAMWDGNLIVGGLGLLLLHVAYRR